MEAGIIKGANRVMNAPPDWDAARQGVCVPLPVLDTGEFFQSSWIPDNHELACLNAGATVIVTIWGRNLPPISVNTTPQPGTMPAEAYEQAIEALRQLAFMARTAGGTAGHDAALTRACEVAERIVGPLEPDARREEADRPPTSLPAQFREALERVGKAEDLVQAKLIAATVLNRT